MSACDPKKSPSVIKQEMFYEGCRCYQPFPLEVRSSRVQGLFFRQKITKSMKRAWKQEIKFDQFWFRKIELSYAVHCNLCNKLEMFFVCVINGFCCLNECLVNLREFIPSFPFRADRIYGYRTRRISLRIARYYLSI